MQTQAISGNKGKRWNSKVHKMEDMKVSTCALILIRVMLKLGI